jgi:hypothetical protein
MGSVACATKKLDGAQWQTAVLGGAARGAAGVLA